MSKKMSKISQPNYWKVFMDVIIDSHMDCGLRVTEMSLPDLMYKALRDEFNDKISPPEDHLYSIFSYRGCYIGRSMGLKTTSIIYESIPIEEQLRNSI